MVMALRKGDKGKEVREIQGLLNSKFGKLVLKPDGDFGGKTDAAVRQFQTSLKLKADGVVGPITWNALHSKALKALFEHRASAHDGFSAATLAAFLANQANSDTKLAAPPSNLKHCQRTSFKGYVGRGYVIKDFKKFARGAIQLRPSVKIIDPGEMLPPGFKNECAALVQYFGVPNTRYWLRGPRVCDFKPGELAEGTVVATLRDGKYYSDYSGRSHVGIYLSHHDYASYLSSKDSSVGVTIMEQYNGTVISRGLKKYASEADRLGKASPNHWIDSSGVVRTKRVSWGKDGEEYYVLITKV
jgi:hypothetical protein